MRMLKTILKSYIYANQLTWKFCKKQLIILVVIKLLLATLPVSLIWCTERLINNVNNFINDRGHISGVLFYFVLEVLITLLTFFLQKVSLIVEQKMIDIFKLDFKKILFRKQRVLPFEMFEDHDFQNNLNRINSNDIKIIKMTTSGIDFSSNFISLIGILFYLITISWWFGPLLLVGMIPLIIVQFKFGRKKYELFKFLTPFGRKEHYIEELLKNPKSLHEVRLNLIEDYIIKKWVGSYQTSALKNLKILISQSKWLMITQMIQMIVYMVSGLFAIILIVRGVVLVGSFVAILQSIQKIQGILNTLTNSLSEIYESSFLINDLKSFLNLKEININSRKKIENVINLEVSGLTFKYPNSKQYALKDININIPQGKKIAIVGVNGSGKTTLLKCLTGLYLTDNFIKVNDIDIKELDLESYHKCIAVLSQDFNKYEFSAKENIGLGRIDKMNNYNLIKEAAIRTSIHSYIIGLPQQYKSSLGRLFEEGNELSGGQWQKIALSRSLFRDGDILFLDEPTASLDPNSELQLIESLFNNSRDTQSIVYITHRLAATKFADEIIVLKEGEVIEKGNHEELIQLEGEYFTLYEHQKQWYSDTSKGEVQLT
ncbi:ABC transporter ATP-binding protein [Ornithinibacillus bavariensis]|uniref:ABC transporter n=1 Tax=Ornithinibacillus bavariensis TaxID=545502 RepID=A0A920C791_9BACI|nr:ABC transporter ATP-binding protein [Ornithinibacillus bavariensis]GIO27418.1 ABC transporter [Ornithinibacillus bavariensis]HAM82016.1 ABC transporter ATP-binding protein [Ornithinibacillus sp.]